MNDEQIRKEVRKNPHNGCYATEICRRCGKFGMAPSGDWKTCPIRDRCRYCFDKEEVGYRRSPASSIG